MKLHWKEVEALAKAHQIEKSNASLDALERSLQWWWCRHYNRPLKDPLLLSYTLDELVYEFLRHFFADPKNDPKKEIEEKKNRADEEAWVAQQLERAKTASRGLADLVKAKMDESTQAATDAIKPPDSNEQMTDLPEISTKFDVE